MDEPSKPIRTAQEVLQFLQTITNREQPQKEQQQVKKPAWRPMKLSSKKDAKEEAVNKPKKKKVDEKIVLKRILQGLQPTMQQFYNNQSDPNQINVRSSTTRLNIYLKQNERILKTFIREQQKRRMQVNKMLAEQQQVLQKQYFFTVKDSYRDELDIFISKNRISKQNYNTLQFNTVFVNLIDNEFKMYKDREGQRVFKTIKLFEIQNVEYNDQPYIFMIISYARDKSKPVEYLYLKFNSTQSQQKWDRILYINYRLKDLKRKEMLFLTEYKDEEREGKKKVTIEGTNQGIDLNHLIQYFAEIGKADQKQPTEVSQSSAKASIDQRSQMDQMESQQGSFMGEPSQEEESREKPNILNLGRSKKVVQQPEEEESQVEFKRETPKNEQPQVNSVRNSQTNRSQPKSKLETLTERLDKGITVEKKTLLGWSKKKLTMSNKGFQYVDLEKLEKGKLKESEKKFVPISAISKVTALDTDRMELVHGQENKKMIIKGDLTDFKEWLKLKIIE